MRPIYRYSLIAVLVIAAAIAAMVPFASSIIEGWAKRDVELRSKLVFTSIQDELADQLSQGAEPQILRLFERLALDERLLAAGFCDSSGRLAYRSRQFPARVICTGLAINPEGATLTLEDRGRSIMANFFPLGGGQVVLVHDLSFAGQRSAEARAWVLAGLAGMVLIGTGFAAFIALMLVRRWLASIREAIDAVKPGNPDAAAAAAVAAPSPLAHEIQQLLQRLENSSRLVDANYVDWTPEALRLLLANELPDAEVIVVSNREPYIHNREADGRITVQRPASGLVSAIEPVMRACGGTWVAHGSGSADKETADDKDSIPVPPGAPAYKLRRLWLSDEEQDGYYYGFANEGLWPLCHIAFVRPIFREEDWNQYRRVNERFAQAVVAEATRPDPIILVQDYHFALLPRMVRERLPDATIITFWHIPWPNAETFGICPRKEEIIDGLLGSSVLGFHTQFHCNNFIDTVDRFIESRIDREHASITVGGLETYVRPYPISIEWPPAALAGQKPVEECRRLVRERYGLPADMRIGVGIERFDYTKGILDRLRAVDSFLVKHPDWKEKFTFIQVAAPTRGQLAAYRNLQDEALALADEINRRHGNSSYKPILLIVRHHEPDEVFELFRAADLCIVSSLHDGMNLVAKEFVAARDDEHGVLILSNFAGASRELSEALIVNPYDASTMGDAIFDGLRMPEAEQRERLKLMRAVVQGRNVYRWAGQMLVDAAELRKKRRIVSMMKDRDLPEVTRNPLLQGFLARLRHFGQRQMT